MGLKGKTDQQFNFFSEISRSITGIEETPEEVFCINRETGLFRIKNTDYYTKTNFVNNSSKLKDFAPLKHIYISRDLTFVQRQELRERRCSNWRVNEDVPTNHSVRCNC